MVEVIGHYHFENTSHQPQKNYAQIWALPL